jgi:protein-S-isoprenylcysteine O-methyltransferase Ste14
MDRVAALAGSAVFLLLAPGVVAGLVPWLLTAWEVESPLPFWAPLRVVGAALIVLGAVALLWSFLRFALEGAGTPAPVAPTERLVVGGLYRYVRNPMYVAVAATIVGQALLLGQTILLGYAALFLALTAAFVRLYEEPTLRESYGDEYEAYRRTVPGWWPRRPRRTTP